MTAAEFQAASIALLRSAIGWQSAIGRRLGVESRTVRRWLAGGKTPAWADAQIAEMAGKAAATGPWPRDEWMVGASPSNPEGRRREYVAHLAPPRFVARIVVCDEEGLPESDETPADVLSGVVYSADQAMLLCEIAWIDEPDPGEIARLLEVAADVVQAEDAVGGEAE